MSLPRALAVLSLITVAACAPAGPDTADVNAHTVALFPDDPGRRGLGALQYAGGLALSGGGDRFGGWSAMEVSADGARLLAISDNGAWITADLEYDRNGDLAGLTAPALAPMLDEDGAPLSGERADAEGLAHLGGGRYAVSFEREHRIAVYDIGPDWSAIETARPEPFPAPPGADRLRANAGAEALVRLDTSLLVGIEDPIMDGQPNTVWRYDLNRLGTPPQSADLALTPGFGLTGLTPDGDGGVIVVERFWAREVGNRIRIGRIPPRALDASGGPVTPEPVAAFDPSMTVDNFEAVALARRSGERRLYLLSDDNFNDAQRTLLLSFIWPED